MTSKKIFTYSLIGLLTLHFIFVLLNQCYQQNWVISKNKQMEKINTNYMNPYFEQHWGMFAPNPPHGNQYIAVQFYTKKDSTELINIHQKILQSSFKRKFSIDQRILKYFNTCYNDILIKGGYKYSNSEFLEKSHGLQSILNYSKIVLLKHNEYLQKIKSNDSIYIDLYLVDEPLNSIEFSKFLKEKTYIDVKNIFLTTKTKLINE
jgi:hypothetical protein